MVDPSPTYHICRIAENFHTYDFPLKELLKRHEFMFWLVILIYPIHMYVSCW